MGGTYTIDVVDLGDVRALECHPKTLKLMDDYSIDGLMFDAGEPSFLPEDAEFSGCTGMSL